MRFDTGHQLRRRDGASTPFKVESLKITDRFLAARPGSVFEEQGREMVLVGYDPGVSGGLPGTPDIDENPYNFVPWMGSNPHGAEEPSEGAHDRERKGRLSGSIGVTFTARTPIFVPAGELGDAGSHNDPPRDFFHCWDGKRQRYAIPGSSVKGAVRSLFEALTNSRAGVTDAAELKGKPLYRRRSFRLFRIVSMPTKSAAGQVVECAYGLYDRRGNLKHRTIDLPDPTGSNGVCELPFAANLFWVGPSSGALPHGHTHKWTKIRFRPTQNTFTLDYQTLQRFYGMKGHAHLRNHGGADGTAATASKCFYGPQGRHASPHAPHYAGIESSLFGLDKGAIIFGLPDRQGRIVGFGRNVNFLWPSDESTLDLMGGFAARAPDQSDLAGSDPAEAVFGFAGTHRNGSHPFRGRVRFSIFWGPERSELKPPCVRLMPLTTPSGTKAKSRPLYLLPGQSGRSADHDSRAHLRGRKLYWHQKGNKNDSNANDDIPPVHRLDEMMQNVPAAWKSNIEKQLGAPIRPLPACTTFHGRVHFHNLTCAELGALLVSLKPDLAFVDESSAETAAKYGLKIGKGKPRGMGSVTSVLELWIDRVQVDAYRDLRAPLTEGPAGLAKMLSYVESYKKRITPQGGRWDDLELAGSLRSLLRLPEAPSARVYPPRFSMYGWLPEPSDKDKDRAARGAPGGGKYPKAMTPAHDMRS